MRRPILARVTTATGSCRPTVPTPAGGNWSRTLEIAKSVLPEIAAQPEFVTSNSDLSALLPDIAESLEQVLAAPGFGDRPTEILWATASQLTVWPEFPPDLAARLNAATEDLRLDVEALADDPKVTRVDTDHSIHEERPDVVTAAIRRVLDQLEP